MELSAKDLELITVVSNAGRRRKRNAWIAAGALLVTWTGVFYFIDALADGLLPALAAFSAMVTFALLDQYANQQSERIENLLLRYVNSDPNSIEQVAEHARSQLRSR